MVEVTLFTQGKNLVGIQSRGHSGAAEKGSDVVCAAVSVLMQALVFGLSEVAGLKSASIHTNPSVPVIRANWPVEDCAKVSLLTETISQSLKIIARDNPKHVKIYSEVINQS
ncbi:MAG: ribosomal-processing cysteine protease Prp [Synergistaceae bacterium]|nr:ribosomal-processing cysteine protease Prp [Synergistaceae bacterium]